MILHPPEKLKADDHKISFLGSQVHPSPSHITKLAFSIIFFQTLMYKTEQGTVELPALILTTAVPSLLLGRAVGKAGCKTHTGWSTIRSQGEKGKPSPTWGHPLHCWLSPFLLLAVRQLKWEKNCVCLAKQSARRLWGGFVIFVIAQTS